MSVFFPPKISYPKQNGRPKFFTHFLDSDPRKIDLLSKFSRSLFTHNFLCKYFRQRNVLHKLCYAMCDNINYSNIIWSFRVICKHGSVKDQTHAFLDLLQNIINHIVIDKQPIYFPLTHSVCYDRRSLHLTLFNKLPVLRFFQHRIQPTF